MVQDSSEGIDSCDDALADSVIGSHVVVIWVAGEDEAAMVRSPVEFLTEVAGQKVDVGERLHAFQMRGDLLFWLFQSG
jgi:hypothetical protein